MKRLRWRRRFRRASCPRGLWRRRRGFRAASELPKATAQKLQSQLVASEAQVEELRKALGVRTHSQLCEAIKSESGMLRSAQVGELLGSKPRISFRSM